MQSKLDYLKNFVKVLIWPILLGLGQFLLIILFTIFFNNKYMTTLKEQYPTLNNIEINSKFEEIIKTNKYSQELSSFLTSKTLIIMIILSIILLPIFIKKYKNLKSDKIKKIENKDYIKIVVTSIFISVTLNLIFYLINMWIPFTNRYNITSTKFSMIITTGILAPILEEYLFRGIVYNELKTFNSKKLALVLTTIVFALMHRELSQIIYATLIGIYLIYLYIKTNDIKLPIIAHITINTSTLLFLPFIVSANIFIQIVLIFIFSFYIYNNFIIENK